MKLIKIDKVAQIVVRAVRTDYESKRSQITDLSIHAAELSNRQR